MLVNLTHKTALVTGASQGIGQAIAQQLAQCGARVAITSNNEAQLHQTQQYLSTHQLSVLTIPGCATSETDIQNIVTQTVEQLGPIDILINNVGQTGKLNPFEDITPDEWQHLFQLNVMSGVHFTRCTLPHMKQHKWGRLLFLSSERAIEPGTHMSHYAMTKAAIISVAKSLANELGEYGITVNTLSPGVILTPAWDADANRNHMSRDAYAAQFCGNVFKNGTLGQPSDIATLASFLCSDEARWITGSNFRIDGGAIKSLDI